MDVMAVLVQSPPVDAPLVHDTEDEVAKDALHEKDLRQELEPDECLLFVVCVVEDLQANSKRHLQTVSVSVIPCLVRDECMLT